VWEWEGVQVVDVSFNASGNFLHCRVFFCVFYSLRDVASYLYFFSLVFTFNLHFTFCSSVCKLDEGFVFCSIFVGAGYPKLQVDTCGIGDVMACRVDFSRKCVEFYKNNTQVIMMTMAIITLMMMTNIYTGLRDKYV
jgi:hypothetical protein